MLPRKVERNIMIHLLLPAWARVGVLCDRSVVLGCRGGGEVGYTYFISLR